MFVDRQDNYVVLTVEELCRLSCQSGDLDFLYARKQPPSCMDISPSDEVMADIIQEGCYPHVMMHHRCRVGDIPLCVVGYAPYITKDPQGTYAVELRKLAPRSSYVSKNISDYDMAELCCYGYFLCVSRQLTQVILRVVYGTEGEGQSVTRAYPMQAEQLRDMFRAKLESVYPRLALVYHQGTVVRDQARRAVFPYREMREAQEDMIRECLRDMRHGQTVFAQAPTGIGKTISTLYPAVRCYGEGRCDQIFYLTAKAATRREAVSAVEKLIAAGTHIKGVVLSSKESMCLCDTAKEGRGQISRFCNAQNCRYAKGYYDKIEGVIQHLFESGTVVFTYAHIKAAAEAYGVCPYALSIDLSELCQVIICDYNYVFSPSVYLKRYFDAGIPKSCGHQYIFLVDEAHNLADRARDMYSGGVSLAHIQAIQDQMQAYEDTVAQERKYLIFPEEDGDEAQHNRKHVKLSAKDLDDLVAEVRGMASLCHDNMEAGNDGVRRGAELTRQLPDVLSAVASDLLWRCQGWLRCYEEHPLYDVIDELANSLQGFVVAAGYFDKNFATLIEVEGEDVRVCLNCLDPSSMLAPRLKWAKANILFSATLTPADYFADILGGDKNSICVTFDSPFPKENLCVVVGDRISTRYEDREKSYRAVVGYIAATVSAKRGNYMVFFPSYQYMTKVQALFAKQYPHVALQVQKSHMTHEEKEAFIQAFVGRTDKLQIGFCVLGGSFSEGLDLPGESLIGAIVVGVGIPGLSSERNIIKAYYDEAKDGEGYAYAYTYPGMNHVLQAAGRVIRRHEDKGVVILLDDRYATPPYMEMYPEHWGNPKLAPDPFTLKDILQKFWKHEAKR